MICDHLCVNRAGSEREMTGCMRDPVRAEGACVCRGYEDVRLSTRAEVHVNEYARQEENCVELGVKQGALHALKGVCVKY